MSILKWFETEAMHENSLETPKLGFILQKFDPVTKFFVEQ